MFSSYRLFDPLPAALLTKTELTEGAGISRQVSQRYKAAFASQRFSLGRRNRRRPAVDSKLKLAFAVATIDIP